IETKISYSKEDLGEIYNIEKKYYDDLEKERVLPQLGKLHRIETFYKVSLIILIFIIVLFLIAA
ncbi:hypothetical protein MM787_002557, partial [Enterococcus faecium]|nr:hypothetical protein [Enterococcus faecium]